MSVLTVGVWSANQPASWSKSVALAAKNRVPERPRARPAPQPQPSALMSGKEAIAAYLERHKLQEHLEAMLNAMLEQRPENVAQWIADFLASTPPPARA